MSIKFCLCSLPRQCIRKKYTFFIFFYFFTYSSQLYYHSNMKSPCGICEHFWKIFIFRNVYPTLFISPLLQSIYVLWIFQCNRVIPFKISPKSLYKYNFFVNSIFFQFCYHRSYFDWLVILSTLIFTLLVFKKLSCISSKNVILFIYLMTIPVMFNRRFNDSVCY